MTMHITKTWIEDGKLITEVFKSEDVYTRTWVGLNWSDLPDEWVGKPAFMEGAKWAERKLEEKNT
jgi:hypothetical protein